MDSTIRPRSLGHSASFIRPFSLVYLVIRPLLVVHSASSNSACRPRSFGHSASFIHPVGLIHSASTVWPELGLNFSTSCGLNCSTKIGINLRPYIYLNHSSLCWPHLLGYTLRPNLVLNQILHLLFGHSGFNYSVIQLRPCGLHHSASSSRPSISPEPSASRGLKRFGPLKGLNR